MPDQTHRQKVFVREGGQHETPARSKKTEKDDDKKPRAAAKVEGSR